MKNREYVIKNVSKADLDKLLMMGVECYPDDMMSNDVYIYGTIKDVNRALRILGRSR